MIDKLSYEGDKDAIPMPEPKVGGYEFSFSGVKTSVINYVNKMKMKGEEFKPEDLAASFQHRVVDILCKKTIAAALDKKVENIVIAGGVAANSLLRSELTSRGKENGLDVYYPSMRLCTDNAAMIAVAGHYKLIYGDEESKFGDLRLNGVASMGIDQD